MSLFSSMPHPRYLVIRKPWGANLTLLPSGVVAPRMQSIFCHSLQLALQLARGALWSRCETNKSAVTAEARIEAYIR